MRPLLLIGYGLVIVAVQVRFGTYDVLADPVGWLLALLGVRRMARAVRLPAAMSLGYLGVLALACSVPLWWPHTAHALDKGDPSVLWAVGLGELAFQAVLCHALAGLAAEAGAATALVWFRICEAGLVVGALAPPLYFGAHLEWLSGVGDLGQILQLAVLILCLCYSGKEWTGAVPRPQPAVDTDQ